MRVPLSAEAVIADAAALADEAGFESVSLSAVARRLGVQAPSLYSHVRDLEAVRDGITALALGELADLVAAGIAGRAGLPALQAYSAAHRTFARRWPGRWQSLQRRAGEAVVRSAAARAVSAQAGAVLRGYPVPQEEHVHAVRLLGSTINGFLALERTGNFDHSSPAPEVSWDRTVVALDALLRAWPENSRGDEA
ncbi:TetR-like C-terminal domain-containing protein [Lentzea sp. NBRC 102530]|uniref:TetR-like C-terminal domain-containing protein n=1 Tax=Lentzea sp. NBRC 102530 TaxID=3032201 RepID=UPI0024A3DE86|nr:TetR-like C-terminal domain-containing protein [Lentzea sp. NBRC 102530]GLY54467.1 TetR family transcriptional regulator [Lentzea sp. NBRC 102530]